MKYFQFIPFILLIICSRPAAAQHSEEEAVKSAIRQLFEGMKRGDSAMVKAVFSENVVMQTALTTKDGSLKLVTASFEKFLTAVGSPHTDVWDERISFSKVLVDGPLASVWTPYQFYLNEKFSHCGVNSFQLFKSPEGGWKIIYLVDTRRKEKCVE
ncbi:nuclear transport factor 2 family protein [Chitinophaga sp. YIM B06452]|uniref:nuclear transport factor 2 family protein n=1 Tax=Chitinophaga sp. YIM B06452 TaxID=3082158 RepID=UPI0031FF3BE9